LPKSEESTEEIAAVIRTWCISGCIVEVLLVEIWLVNFMGEKASTRKTLFGCKCGLKNADSAFLSILARKENDYNVFSSYRFCE